MFKQTTVLQTNKRYVGPSVSNICIVLPTKRKHMCVSMLATTWLRSVLAAQVVAKDQRNAHLETTDETHVGLRTRQQSQEVQSEEKKGNWTLNTESDWSKNWDTYVWIPSPEDLILHWEALEHKESLKRPSRCAAWNWDMTPWMSPLICTSSVIYKNSKPSELNWK